MKVKWAQRRYPIALQIMLVVVVPILLISLMTSLFTSLRLKKTLAGDTEKRLMFLADLGVQRFSSDILSIQESLLIMANSLGEQFDSDLFALEGDDYITAFRDENAEVLRMSFYQFQDAIGLYFMTAPGYGTVPSQVWWLKQPNQSSLSRVFEYPNPEDFDPGDTSLNYYYNPIKSGTPYMSDIYLDVDINVKLISQTVPVFAGSEIIGIIGVDYAVERFESILDELPLGESEYALMVSRSKRVLFHPTLDFGTHITNLPNEDLSPLAAVIDSDQTHGVFHYDFEGQKKVMGFSKLPNGWLLGMTAFRKDLLRPVEDTLLFMLAFNMAAILLSLAFANFLVRKVTRPLVRINEEVQLAITEDSHTLDIPGIQDRRDELGDLTRVFQELQLKNKESMAMLIQENLDKERLSAMGDKLSEVSHEVEGQLATAKTSLSFLSERVSTVSEQYVKGSLSLETFEESLSSIQEAINIGTRSISNSIKMLRSTKKTSVAQTHLVLEEFNVRELVNNIITGLEFTSKSKHIAYDIDIQDDVVLTSYPGYLVQILDNLIRNSLRHGFTSQDSRHIDIQAAIDGDQFILDYHDNGRGIPEELHDRIFDRFFTTAKRHGGTGIGLFLIKAIVETNLGGKVEIVSGTSVGVHFRIQFPKSL